MKKVLLGLFLFFIVNSNLFSQTVIKMKREGGISIIPCKVNGLNLNFIFDTGASNVSLSMTEATFMLKNGYLSESDILGTNKFSDATGKISEGVIINLKEIEIAGLKLYNVKASIVTNNKAPLLLGQSAIGKLGKIQLDLEQNTLTILSGKGSYDFYKNNQPEYSVIGYPTKIGKIEVAEHDFQNEMNFEKAKIACASLGDGWRLPTKEELNLLFKKRGEIGGFVKASYLSSSAFYGGANTKSNGVGDCSVNGVKVKIVWYQAFYHEGSQLTGCTAEEFYVRAVKTIN